MTLNERTAEQFAPYAVGIALTVAWFFLLHAPFPVPAGGLLGASGTAAAVLVGFLATAKAVILGLANTEAFSKLKESGFTRPLFGYLFEAVWGGIVFLIFSLVGFFLDSQTVAMPCWYAPIWICLGVTEAALYIRITGLLFMLLRKV